MKIELFKTIKQESTASNAIAHFHNLMKLADAYTRICTSESQKRAMKCLNDAAKILDSATPGILHSVQTGDR